MKMVTKIIVNPDTGRRETVSVPDDDEQKDGHEEPKEQPEQADEADSD